VSVVVSRGRTRRVVLFVIAGALAWSVIPAATSSAGAIDPLPFVNFIDQGTSTGSKEMLTTSALDGSSPIALTPSSVQTSSYDVSDDGNTVVISGSAGPYLADAHDLSWGVALIVRDVSGLTPTVTSKVISTDWQANPVLSANGGAVWFLSGSALFRYDVVSAVYTQIPLGDFAWATTEYPTRLAVSPDGLHLVMEYASTTSTSLPRRIFAAALCTSAPLCSQRTDGTAYFAKTYTDSAQPYVWSGSLEWKDDSTVVYAETTDVVSPASNTDTVYTATLDPTGGTIGGTSLVDFYNTSFVNGLWWMWQDNVSNPAAPTTSGGSSSDPTTAPAALTPWTGNYYVSRFTPSASAPPAFTKPMNLPVANANLDVSATSAVYGHRIVYDAYNDYLVDGVPGQIHALDFYENQRGRLLASIDGKTFTAVGYTTSATPTPWPGSPVPGSGYLPVIKQTIYYRWYFPGDFFAAAGYSSIRKITMVPVVKAVVAKSANLRRVSGTATRVGGKATLYRLVSGKYKVVATATMTSKGAYSFGFRALVRGSYKVATVADTYAAIGLVTFKV